MSGGSVRRDSGGVTLQGKSGMLKRLQSERFLESTKRKNIHQANSISHSGKLDILFTFVRQSKENF